MNIPFSKPPVTIKELQFIINVLESGRLSGDHVYTKKCHDWIETNLKISKVLLTPSGTHALELSAILLGLKEEDEVIMPSFTFSSTANAFLLRGCKIKFIDIRSETLNMDENLIEQAITKKTKVIVPVHYAGVPCEMIPIQQIAKKYNLFIVEDAAQAILSQYKEQYCGSFGDLGCFSFHETKNITCGEGGAILINNEEYAERAEIIREKGTNRSQFFRGEVDKYTWQDIGSSYLPSDLNAALLYAQLEDSETIIQNRLNTWNYYYQSFRELEKAEKIELPKIPIHSKHNAHIFYFKVKDINERTRLILFLKENGIYATFHYVPLHSSPAGRKYCEFIGEDKYTTKESERLIRMPLYFNMSIEKEASFVVEKVVDFFK